MNRRGLTLVEVIISSLILVFTVAGALFIFSIEKGVVDRTGRMVQAMNFARQTLEQLKNAVRADEWPGAAGDFLFEGVHDTEAFLLLAGTGFGIGESFGVAVPRSYTVTDENPDEDAFIDYKSVTVTVEWDEPLE